MELNGLSPYSCAPPFLTLDDCSEKLNDVGKGTSKTIVPALLVATTKILSAQRTYLLSSFQMAFNIKT